MPRPAVAARPPVAGLALQTEVRDSRLAVVELEGSGWLFAGYLLLLTVEYLGLANVIPALKATRFSTLLAYGLLAIVLVKAPAKFLLSQLQARLLMVLIVFTAASMAWAVVTTYAYESIRPQLDYFGLLVLTVFLVDRPSRIRALCGVAAFLTTALMVRNLDHLTATVRAGVMRAGYFLGDGNDFAWGMVTLLPLTLYLVVSRTGMTMKALGTLGAAAAVMSIVGTQSRGGSLALGGALLYYWLFITKRKALAASVLIVVVAGVLALAPSEYVNRLGTIDNIEEDNSAQGRLRAWGAAAEMALDYPLGVGAGNFNAAYGRFYVPEDAEGWAAGRWISAHSVYFKALGEYGVLGLALILIVIWSNLRANRSSQVTIARNPGAHVIPELWPALINMSIAGYAIAGVFLGGISYPHLYLLTGLTLGCRRLVDAGSELPSQPEVERTDALAHAPIRPRWVSLAAAARGQAAVKAGANGAGAGDHHQ